MPSKPATGGTPTGSDDLTVMSTMARIADRARLSRSKTRVPATQPPAAAAQTGVRVTDAHLTNARLLLSQQNMIGNTRLKFAKRVLMRGSRVFTHRLVAAGQSTTDAVEVLEATHGTVIADLRRQLDEITAAVAAESADREEESRRRDRDTHSLASQITRLEVAQSRIGSDQGRNSDRMLAQLTSIELAVEDSAETTASLRESIRGLASELSTLERNTEHDRSEMRRTRTLVSRLVRTAAGKVELTSQSGDGPDTLSIEQAPAAAAPAVAALDDRTYVDFEHSFRGTRDEIRARQKDAVRFVADLAGAKAPLLDLGCGRGEWLDLARELNIPAYGVDSNAAMVEEATAAGLDARVGDALVHLSSLEESTLQAVSAFHFVEHIPLDVLVALLDSALVALRPGGILLLETPNPTNLVVGAASFFLDPTHLRVVHPDFLSFLVESRGFVDVEVHFVHPVIEQSVLEEGRIDGLEDSARLRRLVRGVEWALFGPQDYLLTARRAEVAL